MNIETLSLNQEDLGFNNYTNTFKSRYIMYHHLLCDIISGGYAEIST